MGAAIALRDVVGEAQHAFVIGVVPHDGGFDRNIVPLRREQDGRRDQGVLGAVEKADKGFQPAFVMQCDFLLLHPALVSQHDGDAGVQEGEFAQTVFEGGVIELRLGESVCAGQEGDFGAAFTGSFSHNGQRRFRHAVAEAHVVFLAVAPDAQVQPFRQRVHHRNADAMQTARNLVGVLFKLTAGVKLGHDHFGSRNAFFFMNAGGDAAAIVAHGAGTVRIEDHIHPVGIAGQRFVDRIVHDLMHHVVQARAIIGIADIHAGAFAHGIEALQDLDGIGAIFVGFGRCAHGVQPEMGVRTEFSTPRKSA